MIFSYSVSASECFSALNLFLSPKVRLPYKTTLSVSVFIILLCQGYGINDPQTGEKKNQDEVWKTSLLAGFGQLFYVLAMWLICEKNSNYIKFMSNLMVCDQGMKIFCNIALFSRVEFPKLWIKTTLMTKLAQALESWLTCPQALGGEPWAPSSKGLTSAVSAPTRSPTQQGEWAAIPKKGDWTAGNPSPVQSLTETRAGWTPPTRNSSSNDRKSSCVLFFNEAETFLRGFCPSPRKEGR